MKTLLLPTSFAQQIEKEGSTVYPNECCGIMYGRDNNDGRIVEELEAVPNVFDEHERYHRFSISPKQLMAAEKKAGDSGRLVIGFYHSHPDHPARPSEYDREHAWPFYSYVIVEIAKKNPAAMTSWMLDEATEIFSQQEIRQT
ncbi:MAG TPA: M67 family metallopeptidase [Tepidisphaeraceae bacterium]|nr:M67 family metallopeptidase [Tepidisphaeraceae bacterium]